MHVLFLFFMGEDSTVLLRFCVVCCCFFGLNKCQQKKFILHLILFGFAFCTKRIRHVFPSFCSFLQSVKTKLNEICCTLLYSLWQQKTKSKKKIFCTSFESPCQNELNKKTLIDFSLIYIHLCTGKSK